MKKNKRSIGIGGEVIALSLAVVVVIILAAIFFLSSRQCGQTVPIAKSLDCKEGRL